MRGELFKRYCQFSSAFSLALLRYQYVVQDIQYHNSMPTEARHVSLRATHSSVAGIPTVTRILGSC